MGGKKAVHCDVSRLAIEFQGAILSKWQQVDVGEDVKHEEDVKRLFSDI